MSESKTYVFGNDANGANNNLLASILPALQNRGIDSSYLMGLMSGNNNGGFFGNNGGFQDIIALIVIAAIFGNGNFGFGGWGNNGNNVVSSTAEREMLLSAIQRNGVDLSQLASSLNCSVGQLDNAIGQVASQICQLTGQVGMSSQQIINSVQFGNSQLANQIANCCCDLKSSLASCCCDIRTSIADSNYLTERGFCNTNQTLAKGFSDIGYAFRDQTCNLEKAGSANTAAIIAKLDAIEDSRKDRELAEKDRVIATLTARSERQAELQPIYSALQEIQCNQPPVKKIACPEQYVPLNTSVNATYGLIPTCGYNTFGGWGWNGYNNGNCCGNSLWG